MPLCPVHGTEMKVSKLPSGGFYCTQRLDDGSYCKQSVRAPKPTTIPASQLPSAPNHDVLAAACLSFAGELFKGAGPELAEDAIALAIKTYRAMRAVE